MPFYLLQHIFHWSFVKYQIAIFPTDELSGIYFLSVECSAFRINGLFIWHQLDFTPL